MTENVSGTVANRVVERRRAVALARHYREAEGLSIAQIADRLGRSPATIKAYFYDPSYTNKPPTATRQFWALAGHARTRICKRLVGSLRRHEASVPDCPICPEGTVRWLARWWLLCWPSRTPPARRRASPIRPARSAFAGIELAPAPPSAGKQGFRGDPARRLTVDAVEMRTFGEERDGRRMPAQTCLRASADIAPHAVRMAAFGPGGAAS